MSGTAGDGLPTPPDPATAPAHDHGGSPAGRSGQPWIPGADAPAPWESLSLPSLVRRPGRQGRPALVLDGSTRTYGQLADGAARLAHALVHRHGVQRLDRVALSARNCLGYLEAEIGIADAGAVMVAVSWRNTDAERVALLRRSEAGVLIADPEMVAGVLAARGRGELPALRAVIALGGADGADAVYEDLVEQPPLGPPARGGLADPHEIIYTSGTTGEPKGAVWTQGAVLWNAVQQALDFGLGPQHSAYVAFDLNYIGGRHQFTWALLQQGGVVHLRRSGGFDADDVMRYITRHRITHVLWVPTMLYDVLALEHLGSFDTSALEMIMCGGAPLSGDTVRTAQRALPRTRVVQVYGLTEGGGTVTYVPPQDLDRKVGSAGLPSLNNQIRIAEPDGTDCEPGAVGEVLVRGPAMTTGYWDDPAATAAALRDGWLWTGDLGHVDDEGFLYIDGRRKELIISGGMNVFPREVEEVLRAHPAVRDAAVIGVPHDRWGETVCAVVERAGSATVSAEELVAHCRERLASYKKPTVVHFVPALPRTLSGKVRKGLLDEWVGRSSGRD